MKRVQSLLIKVLILVVLVGAGVFTFNNYSVVFAKTVSGEVLKVERVNQPMAIVSAKTPDSHLFSFAIAIRDGADGKIYISSSEDQQWALAEKGSCVKAKFYPYPPWNFEKADTYFNARFQALYDCAKPADAGATSSPGVAGTPVAVPGASASPVAPAAAVQTAQPAQSAQPEQAH